MDLLEIFVGLGGTQFYDCLPINLDVVALLPKPVARVATFKVEHLPTNMTAGKQSPSPIRTGSCKSVYFCLVGKVEEDVCWKAIHGHLATLNKENRDIRDTCSDLRVTQWPGNRIVDIRGARV